MSMYEVPVNDFIEKLGEELKKLPEMTPPEWAQFVKTGVHKERPPVRADWWYVRAAAILRSVFMLGPIGTSKLRSKYGGKKNRGHKTEHTYKGSGSIIRKILQQLESAGLVEKAEKEVHKGRVVTGKGHALIDQVAKALAPAKKKAAPKKAEKPKAKKEEKADE